MKKIILSLLILHIFCSTIYAQINAPVNFQYAYTYIMIGDAALCNGQMVNGPAYCSTFTWSPPDTTTTTATLDHYNLYHNDYSTTQLITSVTDTFYIIAEGYIGYLWVTAVYTNPNGESDSSNVVQNDDLPISIKGEQTSDEPFNFNIFQNKIIIPGNYQITSLNLFDLTGKTVLSALPCINEIDIKNISKGIYILDVKTTNQKTYRKKVVVY